MGEILSSEKFKIVDVSPYFDKFASFATNSAYPIHRWYRFKEGYSQDLVHLLLGTCREKVNHCIDPFSGSGTTALACQQLGIACTTFEVNPFMFCVSSAKLETRYTVRAFDRHLHRIRKLALENFKKSFPSPIMSTISSKGSKSRGLFSPAILQGILAIREAISEAPKRYENVFLTILASALSEAGNTFKDGKCVRYKRSSEIKNWSRGSLLQAFMRISTIVRQDIAFMESSKSEWISNLHRLGHGSALDEIKYVEPESCDISICSPPYLNSFDYTDVYMPELWALGFVDNYDELKVLRQRTLRSHVQVKWNIDKSQLRPRILNEVSKLSKNCEGLWNSRLPQMIEGYFLDMQQLILDLQRVLKPNSCANIVIGTSSYGGVNIPTDTLLGLIGEESGFEFEELKIIRKFRHSPQQRLRSRIELPALRESVVRLRKV